MSKARWFWLGWLLLLAGLGANIARAQSESRALLVWENQTITVGQPFQFVLEVRHPRSTTVILPQLPAQFGQLSISAQSSPEITAAPDGGNITRQTISATLYVPGQVAVPPIVVQTIDSGTIGTVEAIGLIIEVQSVLPPDPQVQPDRSVAVLPGVPLWAWLAGGGLGLLALAALSFWGLRRLPKHLPRLQPQTPQLVARAELARIAKLNLPAQDQAKTHYALLTACLLRYFSSVRPNLAVNLATANTNEIIAAYPTDLAECADLRNFLQIADLVKFAKVIATPDDAAQALAQAERLVG